MASARLRSFVPFAIVFVVAFDIAFLWQLYAGAYRSEFGGHPDEAGHYVTGLMMHDYIAAGFPDAPMRYAQEYYRHYPKVALGVWPPFFYLVQTAWTLPFGIGHVPVMLLMAALAAVVAWQLFHALHEEFGPWLAGCAALILLSLPLFRAYYSMVMAETLSAALMFGAALAFGRWLDDERPADAIWFGILAALAILTKGTGLALALTAPLALACTGKWRLLRRPALWAAVAIVVILAGPWTYIFRNAGREHGGWEEPSPSWHFTQQAIPYYAGKFGLALGVVFAVLFAIGLLAQLLRPQQRRGVWASAAALVVGVFIFQCILPVGYEDRHLISTLPAAMMFAVAGLRALRRVAPVKTGTPVSSAFSPGGLLLPFVLVISVMSSQWFEFMNPHPKRWSGFGEVARLIADDPSSSQASILVSSDARGEGMFISELAIRDSRPAHVVYRANKELATMQWSGAHARPRFGGEDELIAWLHKANIDYVVVDDSMPENKHGAHHEQLRAATAQRVDAFWPVDTIPIVRGGDTQGPPLRIYRVKTSPMPPTGEASENPADPPR